MLTGGIECRCEWERVAVFYHDGADAVPGWEARGVWEGGGRHGCGQEDGADQDGIPGEGCTESGCGCESVWGDVKWVNRNGDVREGMIQDM